MDEMEEGKDYKDYLNPNSLKVIKDALIEPTLKDLKPLQRFQSLRHGYFCVDYDSTPEHIVFNRIVPLKDSWAKIAGTQKR
jgi:glutaminyl-tRNA synthetase